MLNPRSWPQRRRRRGRGKSKQLANPHHNTTLFFPLFYRCGSALKRGEGGGGRKRWKKGEAKYTLSYLRWRGGGFAATTCRPRRHSFSRISRPVERSGIIYLLSPSSSPSSLSHTHRQLTVYTVFKKYTFLTFLVCLFVYWGAIDSHHNCCTWTAGFKRLVQHLVSWCPAMRWDTVPAWRIFATWSDPLLGD